MAKFYPDEMSYRAHVTAEIWDEDSRTAVIELYRSSFDQSPVHAFGIHNEEEFLEFYEQLCNAGKTLGWLV